MKIRSSHFLLFLVFATSLSSINLEGMAQKRASSIELEKSMNTFRGRLRIYRDCLRRKCSDEERKVAATTAIKDGLKLLLLAGTIVGTIFFVKRVSATQSMPSISFRNFENIRQTIFRFINNYNLKMGKALQAKNAYFNIDGGGATYVRIPEMGLTHAEVKFFISNLPDDAAVDRVVQFIEEQHGEGLAIPQTIDVQITPDKPKKEVSLTISAFIK